MTGVRADEVQHSGSIEKPMYEHILAADLVIADLSTSNVNAFYELGVRHALRPHTTIIVAEKGFKFAFDIRNIAIRTYEHLGEDIGRREAKRFESELTAAIQAILEEPATDSPVYTFLPHLQAPVEADGAAVTEAAPLAAPADAVQAQSLGMLMDQVKQAMKRSDFITAKGLLTGLHALDPKDDYVVQQLALATYKGEQPSKKDALLESRKVLQTLNPETSHDTETLGRSRD